MEMKINDIKILKISYTCFIVGRDGRRARPLIFESSSTHAQFWVEPDSAQT